MPQTMPLLWMFALPTIVLIFLSYVACLYFISTPTKISQKKYKSPLMIKLKW